MKKKFLLFSFIFFILSGFLFAQEFQIADKISEIKSSEVDKIENSDFTNSDSSSSADSIRKSNDDYGENQNLNFSSKNIPPKMDLDFRFYLPSLLGFTCGDNAFMKFRENYEQVSKSSSFMAEVRGDIFSIGSFSFVWGAGINGYLEKQTSDNNEYSFMASSLGAGVYFHPLGQKSLSLTGLYFFIYPIYSVPFYVYDNKNHTLAYDKNEFYWRAALDFGYNIAVLQTITVSAYMRQEFAWTSSDVKMCLDFGITLGLYLHDPKYYFYE